MTIREEIEFMGVENAVILEGEEFDAAIIGVTTDDQVVYSFDLIVETLMEKDGMSEIEALDYISFNTIRSLPYMGPQAPVIMYQLEKGLF